MTLAHPAGHQADPAEDPAVEAPVVEDTVVGAAAMKTTPVEAAPMKATPVEGTPVEAVPVRDAGEQGADRPPVSRPPKKRDPFFDNAKFIAMILVVIGHAIEPLRKGTPSAQAVYLFLYLFHMPVFIIITGYFSRTFTFSSGKARKLITNLGVPYVVFETAYSVFRWKVGGTDFDISLLSPVWLTWFLLATFAWRLSTPVWQQLRWPMTVAVIVSLLSGMNELPGSFEMHRTLGLLPYFVLGLMLRPEHFEMLRRPMLRVAGGFVLAAGLAGAFLVHGRLSVEWAYWRHGNDFLGAGEVKGTLIRIAVLGGSLVLSAAFLAVVPRRFTWFSALGGATLYAYLLHGFPIKLAAYQGWYRVDVLENPVGVAAIAVAAAVIAVLMMTWPVRRATSWAIEPSMSWAFQPLRRPQK